MLILSLSLFTAQEVPEQQQEERSAQSGASVRGEESVSRALRD